MRYVRLFPVVILLATACEMADADRCHAPYEWREAEAACVIPVDTEQPEVVDTSPVQPGLGEDCYADSDCADYGTDSPDLCLLDPTGGTPTGMCTFTECEPGDCGGKYLCCDCESSVLAASMFEHSLLFCAAPGAAQVLGSVGCGCE
ncbi:MAG: hypothetical protein JXX14_14085 [Deltaproteobacteria bacterium]|nr:hypothetical protein [Deltaproteobacteria bacterium]